MKVIVKAMLVLLMLVPGMAWAQPTHCEILNYGNAGASPRVISQWWNGATQYGTYSITLPDSTTTPAGFEANAIAAAVSFASAQGWSGITSGNVGFAFVRPSDLAALTIAPPTVSADTRSIVTGTGATGFQVSSTQYSEVAYSCQIVTTASIAGNAYGTIVLEIAPTNSSTPSDWVEVGRITNGQALSLAITLQSVQTTAGQISAKVPAGYYVKLRSITSSGTPAYSFVSGQKAVH